MNVQIDLPEEIANIIMGLPLEILKKRILTENGLTLADEERINDYSKNPQIIQTLKNSADIDDFFDNLKEVKE